MTPSVRSLARVLGGALVVASCFTTTPARADLSSWFSVQVGEAKLKWTGREPHFRTMMPIDFGVGSPPSLPVIIGAGTRLVPYFGEGWDYAAYARLAMRSYVTGGFGVAIDGGGYFRKFGLGSSGYLGTLNLGAPWGLVVSGHMNTGTYETTTYAVTIGIDFLRLTVYRLTGENDWPNVNPAWRPSAPPPPQSP